MPILRVYPAYVKGEAEEIIPIDELFLKVWAKLSCSRTDAINKVFVAGLEKMAEDKDISTVDLAISRRWQQIQMERINDDKLEAIYEHEGMPKFIRFCIDNNIDHGAFLARYRVRLPYSFESKSKMIESWLTHALNDGQEQSTDAIKQMAESENVIVSDDDWNLMKSIASRKGYSGGAARGYWRKLQS